MYSKSKMDNEHVPGPLLHAVETLLSFDMDANDPSPLDRSVISISKEQVCLRQVGESAVDKVGNLRA